MDDICFRLTLHRHRNFLRGTKVSKVRCRLSKCCETKRRRYLANDGERNAKWYRVA